MNGDPLLTVENLTTHFHTDEGTVHAVDGVSFSVNEGETVCLVGESGSGKSVTSESITRLINIPPGDIAGGSVRFRGRELTEISENEIRTIRGDEIAHVFQNPQDALNPVYTAATQIGEVMKLHTDMDKKARRKRTVDLLDRVGLPNPATIADTYPHELSGGQKQRVVIAMALAGQPDLLIADEPTTALDVTIQAQILDLFAELQDEFGMAILFVTHDLGVVAQIADRVVVMYAGKIMERGGVDEVFDETGHPYTRGLLECLPGRGGSTRSIGGDLPSATDPPDGCRFAPRCPYAIGDCEIGEQPGPVPVGGNDDHVAGCLFHKPEYDTDHLSQQVEWGDNSLAADGGEES